MPDPVQLITHKVIFLNGPPKCGKDTAAQHIMRRIPWVRHRKFSAPLTAAACMMFAISDELFYQLERSGNNDFKNEKLPELMGRSWREVLISLSEDYMKPTYGKDVFGQLMKINLMRPYKSPFSIISDSGFDYEAAPIIEHFGPRNCALWRIHRPGCNFDNDSRDYWHDPRIKVTDINNEHELDIFRAQINVHVKKFTGIDLLEV